MNKKKSLIISLLVSLIAGPFLAIILTVTGALSGLEKRTGMEMVGHSGPSGFIFLLSIALVAVLLYLLQVKSSKQNPES